MYKQPRFSPVYDVRIHEDGILLAEDDQYTVLRGRVCQHLAPLLNGKYDIDHILNILDGVVSPEEVYFTLMGLEDAGYLVEGDHPHSKSEMALWNRLGVDMPRAEARLQYRTVELQTFDRCTTGMLAEVLRDAGVRVSEKGDLLVVLTPDYLHPDLAALNRDALADAQPFLLAKWSGTTIWLGPLILPGVTGCWACLAHRLQANRPLQAFTNGSEHSSLPMPSLPASVTHMALGMVTTEVLRWIVAPDEHPLENKLIRYDPVTLEQSTHAFTQRPQCPACGHPDHVNVPKRIALQPRPLVLALDGGYRTTTPQETLAQYERHVSPITGVVRSLRSVPMDDTDLVHTYTAGHSLQLAGVSIQSLRHDTRDHSGGKGRTDLQARASGLCEALERYSAVFQGDEPRRSARFVDLGNEAIHPNLCMLFSDQQYKDREMWNAGCAGHYQIVQEPFDPSAEIEWTAVWSLTHDRFCYLPTAYCYFGYEGPGRQFCRGDSNGLAAGNCLEEAILQGFMELVERDAVALWWYNRTQHSAVDLNSFQDPYITSLEAYYRSLGRELWVLDVTSDLGIPVFVACSRQTVRETEEIILGMGAHPSARIALMRALTELNQTLPAILQTPEKRRAQLLPDFRDVLDWWETATLENQPYLAPSKADPIRTATDYRTQKPNDLTEDVHRCIEIAEQHGLEVLALDLTRPDIGLSVAKVFVPGLRHFWKRLAPGRLYDIPVALGHLAQPLSEDQLNPIPLFL